MAPALCASGPRGMDVDGSAEGGEWTLEEMHFMRAALEQARVALHRREVPVGCVIVRGGRIIARGFNLTNELRNATRHAEFQAIDEVLRQAGGDPAAADFRSCHLYVSCEPCIMCAGALSLVGMGRVYFGCPNDKFGGCGSILAINEHGCGQCGRDGGAAARGGDPPHGVGFERRGGLYAEAAIQLLQDFYLAGNPKAPKPARPVVDVPPWELEADAGGRGGGSACGGGGGGGAARAGGAEQATGAVAAAAAAAQPPRRERGQQPCPHQPQQQPHPHPQQDEQQQQQQQQPQPQPPDRQQSGGWQHLNGHAAHPQPQPV